MEGIRTVGLLAPLWVKDTQCRGKLLPETPVGGSSLDSYAWAARAHLVQFP